MGWCRAPATLVAVVAIFAAVVVVVVCGNVVSSDSSSSSPPAGVDQQHFVSAAFRGSPSHHAAVLRVGGILAERGHRFTFYCNKEARTRFPANAVNVTDPTIAAETDGLPGLYYIHYAGGMADPELRAAFLELQSGNPIRGVAALTDIQQREFEAMMVDPVLEAYFRNNPVDVTLVDAICPGCYLHAQVTSPREYAYFVPGPIMAGVFDNFFLGHTTPAYIPTMMTSFTAEMNFLERVGNYVLAKLVSIVSANVMLSSLDANARAHDLMTMTEVYRANPGVVFAMGTWGYTDARPLSPHVMNVGPLLTGPGEPLPPELDALCEASVSGGGDGLIYVAFGSNVDFFPPIARVLIESFKLLSNQTILMAAKGSNMAVLEAEAASGGELDPAEVGQRHGLRTMVFGDATVHVTEWAPQNDLLADPRVAVFLTHGGLNSAFEAIYHATPTVVMPFAADQDSNAMAAQAKGFGRHVHKTGPAAHVADAIRETLSDQAMAAKLEQMARLARRMPGPVGMADGLEMLAEIGASHLHPAGLLRPWWFNESIDVIAFLAVVVSAIAWCCLACCRRLCGCCCSRGGEARSNKAGKGSKRD